MTRKANISLFALLLLAVFPAAMHGAGFLLYEHGAAAMAMGGAFTGLANDPSAIWHNPAGIAWLDGTQIMGGGTLVLPRGTLTMDNLPGAPVYHRKNQTFALPNFYATHRINKQLVVGVGVFAPFGLGTDWPNEGDSFPLRYLGTKSDMKTIMGNAVAAYKFSDHFSIGIGVFYADSTMKEDITQSVTLGGTAYDLPTSLDVHGTAWGYNCGALYKIGRFSAGINYRSKFDIKYRGTIASTLDYIPEAYQPYIPTSGNASLIFKFPGILTVGVAYRLTDKLTVAADLHDYLWGRYDEYTVIVDYPAGYSDEELVFTTNWHASLCYRLGFDYKVNDKLNIRWGALYDETPQPETEMNPNLADAARFALTGGFGYKLGKFSIDVAYQYEHFLTRSSDHKFIFGETDPNYAYGTYRTMSHLICVDLTYHF